GYYWIEESGCYDLAQLGQLSHYFDYERYGRDVCLEQGGIFHSGGYVYHTGV
ncbi:antirestriction protein ArdA, partial [Providencia stuartii]